MRSALPRLPPWACRPTTSMQSQEPEKSRPQDSKRRISTHVPRRRGRIACASYRHTPWLAPLLGGETCGCKLALAEHAFDVGCTEAVDDPVVKRAESSEDLNSVRSQHLGNLDLKATTLRSLERPRLLMPLSRTLYLGCR